jgi:hypothetical protein
MTDKNTNPAVPGIPVDDDLAVFDAMARPDERCDPELRRWEVCILPKNQQRKPYPFSCELGVYLLAHTEREAADIATDKETSTTAHTSTLTGVCTTRRHSHPCTECSSR